MPSFGGFIMYDVDFTLLLLLKSWVHLIFKIYSATKVKNCLLFCQVGFAFTLGWLCIHLVNFTMGVLKTQRGSMGLILGYFLLGLVWTVLYSTGISTEIVYLKLYPVDILLVLYSISTETVHLKLYPVDILQVLYNLHISTEIVYLKSYPVDIL